MAEWSFLTNHARALVCIAHDPGVRLIDVAAALGVTERSAYAIVKDLTTAGYVVKEREGRRNRYEVQHHLPLPGDAHPLGDRRRGPRGARRRPAATAVKSAS